MLTLNRLFDNCEKLYYYMIHAEKAISKKPRLIGVKKGIVSRFLIICGKFFNRQNPNKEKEVHWYWCPFVSIGLYNWKKILAIRSPENKTKRIKQGHHHHKNAHKLTQVVTSQYKRQLRQCKLIRGEKRWSNLANV